MPQQFEDDRSEQQFLDEVKRRMGWLKRAKQCETCRHFVPDDCSGARDAKASHCKLSPLYELPTDSLSSCDHHAFKLVSDKP